MFLADISWSHTLLPIGQPTPLSRGCHDWLRDQACGDFMQHISEILVALSCPGDLQQCRFATTPVACGALKEDMVAENDFSDVLGQFIVLLAGLRMRRHLALLCGYPLGLLRAFLHDGSADRRIKEFKLDYDIFTELSEMPHRPSALDALYQRHLFHKTSVRQCVAAMKESAFTASDDFLAMLKSHTSGVLVTQAVEDIIGYQKNNKAGVQNKRFRRPLFSMHSALKAKVLQERHAYKTVSMEVPLRSKSDKVPPDTFVENPKKRSLAFKEVASTKPAADWWSPCPTNNSTPTADLATLRAIKAVGFWELAGQIKYNDLFKHEHRFVFRFISSGDESQWFWPCSAFPDSSILVIPCKRKFLPGRNDIMYFDFILPVSSPVFKVVTDITDVEACSIQWKSGAWQYQESAEMLSLGLAVRPVREKGPMMMFDLACTKAFWALPRTTIVTLAHLRGISVEKSANLFDALFTVLSGRLEIEDDEVLKLISARLGNDQLNMQFASGLLDIDAAIQVLDWTDHQVVHDAQAKVKTDAAVRSDFVKSYKEKKMKVRSVLEKAKPKAKPQNARGKRSATQPAAPSTISQATAKMFVPPSAFIWRGVSRCDWNGHLEPYRRVRATWSKFGEEGAMKEVLRMLWEQHCEKEGLPFPDACPHKGLLFGGASVSSSSGA